MDDLSPFKKVLRWSKENFRKELALGRASAYAIAVMRLTIEIMERQLTKDPSYVKSFLLLATPGHPAEVLWQRSVLDLAVRSIDPQVADPMGYSRKVDEYQAVAEQLVRNVRKSTKAISRREVIIVRHNQQTKFVVDQIATALLDARRVHEFDPDFVRTPVWPMALHRLLYEERRDLLVALRITLQMPADVTVIAVPEERPTYVEVIEFSIGFIPIVGNAVAAYEAYAGKDLFGYQLSDVERGILGASVLLPVVGRLAKGGRALYTASRMQKLYGDDAFKWSYSLAMGERLSADAVGIGRLKSADEAVAAGNRITKQAANELADTFKAIGVDAAEKAIPKAVDSKFVAAFERLVKNHPQLDTLDPLAVERIVAKGPNADHIKGQLLEELLESQIVAWLRNSAGKRALGLMHIDGQLEFIPGHLIRDAGGRQITDGMIVRHRENVLEVVAVFEAKAGKSAARELSSAATRRAKLPKEAADELRAYAKDVLQDLQERARIEGTTVTKTLDDIMEEIKLTESGGQVRRDIERLSQAEIFVGSRKASIKAGPKTTKFFGVLPSDVKADTIAKQLAEAGLPNFEVLGINITQKELNSSAKTLADALKTP